MSGPQPQLLRFLADYRLVGVSCIAMLLAGALAVPSGAIAFDTGPHTDITRDAMLAEGFSKDAADVGSVNNWFVDLYTNASEVPQSGHAGIGISLVGSFLGPREDWPTDVVAAAQRLHFDSTMWNVKNGLQVGYEWERLQRATSWQLRQLRLFPSINRRELSLLSIIGISLHELQDFYSHSNWNDPPGVAGSDGPDWDHSPFGSNPTWFDLPSLLRTRLNVYTGNSQGHRDHGQWNSDGNSSLKTALNKDWPGRLGYDRAYMTSYFATRQWLRAMKAYLGDDSLWEKALNFAATSSQRLSHDVKGASLMSSAIGHWQGQGEPCSPSLHLDPQWLECGSREGLGGTILSAKSAADDYFGSITGGSEPKSIFRSRFEDLVPSFGLIGANYINADLLPIASSRTIQAATRFVKLALTRYTSPFGGLGDPLTDRADDYATATIAGQPFQSGVINGHDEFNFNYLYEAGIYVYAPFTFIKAVPSMATYPEPIRDLTAEVRTSDVKWAGTNDDVRICISESKCFPLDKSFYNDFERGDQDTYSVPIDGAALKGLAMRDITQVRIVKSADGWGGAWKLGGLKLWANDRLIYQRSNINRWVQNGALTWQATDFTPGASLVLSGVPTTLDLWDQDSSVYGDDDHGDINPLADRKRLVLAYSPGDVPVKGSSVGGKRFGGRFGDGDEASVWYRLSTLTPTVGQALPPGGGGDWNGGGGDGVLNGGGVVHGARKVTITRVASHH